MLPRLQEETHRVEDVLCDGFAIERLLGCFVHAKANSFENLLEPFLKVCRLSSQVVTAISSTHPFFHKLSERLNHSKAIVRLNLLRILRIICETSLERAQIVERYGFVRTVQRLREKDPAVLVKEMASDLLPILLAGATSIESPKLVAGPRDSSRPTLRRKVNRRSTSEASANETTTHLPILKSRPLKLRSTDTRRKGQQ